MDCTYAELFICLQRDSFTNSCTPMLAEPLCSQTLLYSSGAVNLFDIHQVISRSVWVEQVREVWTPQRDYEHSWKWKILTSDLFLAKTDAESKTKTVFESLCCTCTVNGRCQQWISAALEHGRRWAARARMNASRARSPLTNLAAC